MDFKFVTSFSSVIRPLVSEEKDVHLALASLIDVGNFIPDIDTSKNVDVLPIAFNACVVNRANKNGDVIDTETAINIYKNFINKPINIEHNRQHVVGCILSASFSEFGSDLPLSEEEIRNCSKPFNITLGGIIWKTVNQQISNIIEESNDPTSEHYQAISASWELGFDEYNLILTEGDSKNIENGEMIFEEEKIKELEKNLKSCGGTGRTEDNKNVYRQVVTKVVPLGIGLTSNPAADVKGVAVRKPVIANENFINNKSNSSQIEILHVFSLKSAKNMKLTAIKEITDETMKELSASSVTNFIETELQKALEQYTEEKNKMEVVLLSVSQEKDQLVQEQLTLKSELVELKAQLENVLKVQKEKEQEEAFNQRMSFLEEEFPMNDEMKAEVAQDLKNLNNKEFIAYQNKIRKMSKWLIREEKSEVKASIEINTEIKKVEDAATEIVEKAEEIKDAAFTSSFSSETSLMDKYKTAFQISNFNIKY